ncbi:MAG: dipeptidase [Bacteroidales bacterium]|nr:dipeptidase [Bacteroidales bacterium]
MMHFFDSHVDTPSQLIRLRDPGIDNRYGHVDFPKLRRGGVGGSFFALYTPTEMAPDAATRYALEMLSAVYDSVEKYPEQVAMAFTPEDALRNMRNGLVSIFMGMENGSPFQESIPLLRTFHRMGVRYVTLTHNGDNALADSAAEGTHWHGLSPFGKKALAEMNALGMMVDLSHASDETFWDCIRLSRAPVIASHSCCRALCCHRRNLTDDMLKALADKDGYVGINFYPAFLSERFLSDPADAALFDVGEQVESEFIADPSDPVRVQAWNGMQDRLTTIWRPGVKEIVDHIDHAVELAGIEHVGIGSDFDGILVPPAGLENVSLIGKVFDEMRQRGYPESAISKVAGENLMAVMRRIQE